MDDEWNTVVVVLGVAFILAVLLFRDLFPRRPPGTLELPDDQDSGAKWHRITDLDSEPIEVWKQVTHRRTQYRLTAAGDGPNGRGEG